MTMNPLNDIFRVYLEQVATSQVEEGVRPGNVETPLDKTAFKKRRRSLAGKEKSADARARGHEGKTWANSGRTYSPDEAKSGRANMSDTDRAARYRVANDPDSEHDNYPAQKTKNLKKLRKQKAMGESAVPGKPAERLGAVTAIPQDEREAARERVLAKAKAKRGEMKTEEKDPFGRPGGKYGGVKKGGGYDRGYQAMQKKLKELDKVKTEALDPVGKEDIDIDNDGKKNTKKDEYLLNRRKAISQSISTQKEAKEVKKWWDDDGDGRGYEKGEVSGKFKKNKKSVKEGFSNWREDLVEVMSAIEKEKGDGKIVEKKVENKIKINPTIDEAVENLGGTLLEMVEIGEVDYIVESVYDELLDEGYAEDDIEEALEYALTEAKVTFGHDTPTGQKKSGNLVAAVGRLARQKLSSKVRGAKKAAKQAVATGARKVAKGALGVARKMEGGDKKPSTPQRKPSTYRGAGAGTKERVSSGSYTPPTKKKAEKPADPWKGSSTVPQKPKPKPKADKPSDPWEGSATTPAKPKAKTKKASAPKAKAPDTTTPKRKKKSKLDDLLASVRSEQVNIDEKTLTSAETKEKERLVKSMKDRAGDFEKRYPGRGREVMYATATKMAKKIAEQAMELQPKTQPQPKEKPLDTALEKQKYSNLKMVQQKQQQLQRQKLNLQRQGRLPLESD